MAKLIVEYGGEKKAFKLGAGKVTIGSGASCKLSYPDSDLAEVHAELESGEEVVLRLKKGVTAAKSKGRPIGGEHTMAHDERVQLGQVTIAVHYEGRQAQTLVERRGQAGKAQRARAAAGASAGSASARRQPVVQRERRTVKRGMPTWLILMIVAVLLFAGYRAMQSYTGGFEDAGFDEGASYQRIQNFLSERDTLSAEAELERVNSREELKPGWREKFDALEQRVADSRADKKLAEHNLKGNTYLDQQLKKFEAERLKGRKERPKVRVFLKRCKHFRDNWPQHPDLSWVRRMETRYSAVVSLDDPPTMEDLAFEVKTLTWAKPRDYKAAFKLLNDFVPTASPDDRLEAKELIGTMELEEAEYYEWCLQEAKHMWNEEMYAKSVEWLVQCVIKLNNQEMVDGAAERLLQVPDVDQRWGGYKRDRLDAFQGLARHPKIRARLAEKGLL